LVIRIWYYLLGMTYTQASDYDLSQGTFRCSFTLPRQLARDIADVARQLRVTQSALLAELLAEPMRRLTKLAALVPRPDEVTPEAVRRLRGASADLIRTAVQDAVAAANQVDKPLL